MGGLKAPRERDREVQDQIDTRTKQQTLWRTKNDIQINKRETELGAQDGMVILRDRCHGAEVGRKGLAASEVIEDKCVPLDSTSC